MDETVLTAYREFMRKRRKLTQVIFLIEHFCFIHDYISFYFLMQGQFKLQVYMDSPFLSKKRQKNLLYNENAKLIADPISLYMCDVQAFVQYLILKRNSMYRPRYGRIHGNCDPL